MENTIVSHSSKETIANVGNDIVDYVSSLYEEVKSIYKNLEFNRDSLPSCGQRVLEIYDEFERCNDKKGVIFCLKALAIISERKGDNATDLNGKVACYEQAHDTINDAVLQAIQIKWKQPALAKHQAIIKSKLGNTLHEGGDHYNANILEADAFKIFGKILSETPCYAEAHLEAATASFNKLKWSLRKMLYELNKAEDLFKNPKDVKHAPDAGKLQSYQEYINNMRNTVGLLLSFAK